MTQQARVLLSLDVGTRRIGVAVIDGGVNIARPLGIVEVNGEEISEIKKLYDQYQPEMIIVGYPRNQSGEPTAQTALVEAFTQQLKEKGLPTAFQDESLTSVLAEEHLKATKRPYSKGDIDAVAAALILTDYAEAL
jgi:putative Holliday junction resolvase